MRYINNFRVKRTDDPTWNRLISSIEEQFNKISDVINGFRELSGSITWNPNSIADGDMEAKEITVTGAELGDFVLASFSLDVLDLLLNAQVTASNTVTCVLANNTGGPVDLDEGTLYVRIFKK